MLWDLNCGVLSTYIVVVSTCTKDVVSRGIIEYNYSTYYITFAIEIIYKKAVEIYTKRY